MNDIKVIYFDRTDVFEEIDVNKTSQSKEGDICLTIGIFKQRV